MENVFITAFASLKNNPPLRREGIGNLPPGSNRYLYIPDECSNLSELLPPSHGGGGGTLKRPRNTTAKSQIKKEFQNIMEQLAYEPPKRFNVVDDKVDNCIYEEPDSTTLPESLPPEPSSDIQRDKSNKRRRTSVVADELNLTQKVEAKNEVVMKNTSVKAMVAETLRKKHKVLQGTNESKSGLGLSHKRARPINSDSLLVESFINVQDHEVVVSFNEQSTKTANIGSKSNSLLLRYSNINPTVIKVPENTTIIEAGKKKPRTRKSARKLEKEKEWRERQKINDERTKVWKEKQKEMPCPLFLQAKCRLGDTCNYKHAGLKPPLCRSILSGHCKFGDKCVYSHETKNEPCRFFHGPLQKCAQGNGCKFLHATKLSKEQRDALERQLSNEKSKQHQINPIDSKKQKMSFFGLIM